MSNPVERQIIELMEGPKFVDLLTVRVADWELRGGTKASYARHVGIKPNHLSLMLKGGVAIPKPEARRALARDLGIRPIDFFLMAGELTADEIPGGDQEPMFPPGDVRIEIVNALREVDTDDDRARRVLESLLPIIDSQKQAEEEESR